MKCCIVIQLIYKDSVNAKIDTGCTLKSEGRHVDLRGSPEGIKEKGGRSNKGIGVVSKEKFEQVCYNGQHGSI